MSIIESIKKARERGISDERIFEKIKESNPEKREILDEAIKKGATFTQIINGIISQNEEKERKKREEGEKRKKGGEIKREEEKKKQGEELLTVYPETLIPKTSKKPSLFQKIFIRIIAIIIILSLLFIVGFFYFAGFLR